LSVDGGITADWTFFGTFKVHMKRSRKLVRRLILAIVVVLLTSGVLFGGYRALTRSTPDQKPLNVIIKPTDFNLRISANGELQSAESVQSQFHCSCSTAADWLGGA
jgi:hypothetical protein